MAVLGPEELHFHTGRTGREGEDFVLHLRYDDITALRADGPAGTLTVATGDEGEVVLQLGRLAVAWKAWIDERPSVLRDLGLTPKSRVAWVGVDDDVMEQALGGLEQTDLGDGLDAMFAGAEHRADLARLEALAQRVRPDGGVLWVVVPAESRVIAEAELAAAARALGLALGRTVELPPGRRAFRLTRR
jgi:hypothetical protein